jgi:hypothetical protein
MSTNTETIAFNKNKFTQDFLSVKTGVSGYDLFTRYSSMLEEIKGNQPADSSRNIKEIHSLIEYHQKSTGDQVIVGLYTLLLKFLTEPGYALSSGFIQYWNFMQPLFESKLTSESLHIILSKLSVFDEETQLKLMKYVEGSDLLSNQEKLSLQLKIYQNKEATLLDKVNATFKTRDHDLLFDVVELLKESIKQELAKEFPNPNTIKELCGWANELLTRFARDLPYEFKNTYVYQNPQTEQEKSLKELQDYLDMVTAEFDINNILKFGSEHFVRTTKTLEERLATAERTAKEAEQRANALTTTNEQLQTTINSKEAEIKRKETELSEEKTKTQRLSQQANLLQTELDSKSNFLKILKMKLATLKMGMFGNGKEFQTWLANELDSQLSH